MTEFVNSPSTYGQMVDVVVDGDVKKLPVGPPFAELGGSGLKRSAGIIDEEFLPALRGTKGVKVFSEMSNNDATVGGLLFTIEKLLRQVEWTVVSDENTPEQSQAVEFVEQCMEDMSHSFDDLITEILSMMPFGWSWHEIVYKKRIGPWETDPRRKSRFTDGKIGWRKMPIRAQETLHHWLFDETGGIRGMVQIPAPDYVMRTLAIERSLLFRVGSHKGNPEGRSLLRNAYRPWFFKKRLEEFEAIGVERDLAGLPFASVPSTIMKPNATPEQKAMFNAFKKLVSNVRRDEHDGVVIPSDVDPDTKQPEYKFELLSTGGGKTFDTNALIERYATEILSTVLADFIKVGHEQTGSYALHVDKTGIFRAALNSVAQSIADVFNRHAIPRLFAINQWKLDVLPQLKPSNVDPPNLAELSAFMQTMAGLGMTFFPDPDLEKFLRETAHLPDLPEDVEEMRRQMAEQQHMMEFADSSMMLEGSAQKQKMVEGGMSPEQAEMQSQGVDPAMQANADGTKAKTEMTLAAGKQKMEIDGKTGQQQVSHDLKMKQQELSHTKNMNSVALSREKKMAALKAQGAKGQGKPPPKKKPVKKSYPENPFWRP